MKNISNVNKGPETLFWLMENKANRLAFKNPNKNGVLNTFIQFLLVCRDRTLKPTRKHFLAFCDLYDKKPYMTEVLAAATAAGIIEVVDRKNRELYYGIGPNYYHYLHGKLKRIAPNNINSLISHDNLFVNKRYAKKYTQTAG